MVGIGGEATINNEACVRREPEGREAIVFVFVLCVAGYAVEMVSSALLGFGAIFVWVVPGGHGNKNHANSFDKWWIWVAFQKKKYIK